MAEKMFNFPDMRTAYASLSPLLLPHITLLNLFYTILLHMTSPQSDTKSYEVLKCVNEHLHKNSTKRRYLLTTDTLFSWDKIKTPGKPENQPIILEITHPSSAIVLLSAIFISSPFGVFESLQKVDRSVGNRRR